MFLVVVVVVMILPNPFQGKVVRKKFTETQQLPLPPQKNLDQ